MITPGPAGSFDERSFYSKYWQELPRFDVVIDHSWAKWSLVLKMEGVLKAPVLCVCHAPVDTMFKSLPDLEKPCFVCISEDQRSHFEALFGRPARTARNGVDPDFYRPTGVPRSGRYLFLARFSTIKGPDIAIEACRAAGVGLDLVGDTSITNEPEFLEKCKRMVADSVRPGDGQQIRLVGPATRGECVHWFSRAHCLLHPNQRFREPLGLAPVESQMCGTPVIAWRYGAMSETVKHGETGFLVNSADDMVKLIREGAAGTIDRNRCREWAVENFSLDRMIKRYETLCVEALDTGGW